MNHPGRPIIEFIFSKTEDFANEKGNWFCESMYMPPENIEEAFMAMITKWKEMENRSWFDIYPYRKIVITYKKKSTCDCRPQ